MNNMKGIKNIRNSIDSYKKYKNHGSIDSFTTIEINSGGTAQFDEINHEVDLSTGNGGNSYAIFRTKKSWTLGVKPLKVDIILNNIVDGAGGTTRRIEVGFGHNFALGYGSSSIVEFTMLNSNWLIQCYQTETYHATYTGIASISNGDLLSIRVTTGGAEFYKNNILVGTIATDIPSDDLNLGIIVSTINPASPFRSCSVSYMSIK